MSKASGSGRVHASEPAWLRGISLVVVVVALAALLVAGLSIGRARPVAGRRQQPASMLPGLVLSTSTATVWNCPGPLLLGGGSRAAITVVNPSSHSASLTVFVAETATAPGVTSETSLPVRVSKLQIRARSELNVPVNPEPLPKASETTSTTAPPKGPSRKGHRKAMPPVQRELIFGSVSLTVTGAEVAVTESVSSPNGVLSSPCAVGAGSKGYTASGVTSGSSDVKVALFNPDAAPAVVNISVGTGAGIVQPQQYQGVVVAPKSLSVIDLARYVPFRSHVALAVTATVGRFVVGSLSAVSARFTTARLGPGHSYFESGSALAVGVGRPLASWLMPLGPVGPNESEAVRIFDPGTAPAEVTLTTRAAAVGPSTLSLVVRPGQTVTAMAPVVPSAARAEGTLTVTTRHRVGVVVEHETYQTQAPGRVILESSSATVSPASKWVLPVMQDGRHLQVSVIVTSTTLSGASIAVNKFNISTPSDAWSATPIATSADLAAGTSVTVRLGPSRAAGSAPTFGIEV
ncbi:MAG: hypothetical protein ACYDBS_06415, partial [Acidimicrobiales bacterium]